MVTFFLHFQDFYNKYLSINNYVIVKELVNLNIRINIRKLENQTKNYSINICDGGGPKGPKVAKPSLEISVNNSCVDFH